MKNTVLATLLTALTALSGCASEAAPPRTSTSETKTMTVDTSSNKELVLRATGELFGNHDAAAVDRHWSPSYKQHNPTLPSGLDPMRAVAGMSSLKTERVRALADGNLVALQNRYVGWGPKPVIAFDIFRVHDGKIVEHWDGIQEEAPKNPSGHTMIDGPTESVDHDKTDANRALVKSFVEAVLVRGEADKLPTFVDAASYTQHNPAIADGLAGLGAFLGDLKKKGVSFSYAKVHRVVAEGSLVLTQSEGEIGGKKQVFYDLFRVAGGKIVEHWDVVQEVPATTKSGLGMF
jgi:predicted SnoaL-like aldol condensation-catalyzing enzyme